LLIAIRETKLCNVNISRIDTLVCAPLRQRSPHGSRAWREWCFVRVAFRHFRIRFLLMLVIIVGGGAIFMVLEPQRHPSLIESIYSTWSLVFAQPTESFPQSLTLQVMFFLVPVLGLTVIIEGIIDFALMLRERRRYERSWCTMLANSFSDHIVLVGFGKLGYRVFSVLRKLGEAVVVIERDASNGFLDEIRRDGSPLLIGDARREALLEEANIAKARSIVLATDDDLANLEVALDAQHINPRIRVVLRMFDQNMADKFSEGFKIHLAASPSAIAAPTFATSAVASSIVSSYIVGNQLIAMQRAVIDAEHPMCNRTIGQIMTELGVGIVQHSPAGSADQPRFMPPPDTRIKINDEVIVQGPLDVLARLERKKPR
jgi:voltage-gated potassium channel